LEVDDRDALHGGGRSGGSRGLLAFALDKGLTLPLVVGRWCIERSGAFAYDRPMQNSGSGRLPVRVAQPADAFELVRRDGAAILPGCGLERTEAREVARRVLGSLEPVIPDPAPIKEGGGNADRSYENLPGAEPGLVVPFQTGHTDGFAYGDRYPDFIFLLCVRPALSGGESFVVDTYQLLDQLAASPNEEDRAFHQFLMTVPVEQTEPGFQTSLAPVIGQTAAGRRMSRWTPVQRPDDALPAAERERHAAWLARWRDLAHEASLAAPRFTLQPGETICLDNYRMLHGRTGFDDVERTLWRIWAWTTEAPTVPEGLLFSDSRFAVVK
jgi:gamma-butyrobetaine dioxygenase